MNKIILIMVGIMTFTLHANTKIEELSNSKIKLMESTGVWKKECPVPLNRLKLIKFSYVNFKGTICHDGEIIVMDAVAPYVAKIFNELYDQKFPIHQAKTMDIYQGDDEKAMSANNTSAFNFRVIANSTQVSIHGYGLAIDLNPQQNPCITNSHLKDGQEYATIEIFPALGKEYLNRTNQRPGMVESIKNIFYRNGFRIWGGSWNDPLDLHHFQTPRWLAELLSNNTIEDAANLFKVYVSHENIQFKEELILAYETLKYSNKKNSRPLKNQKVENINIIKEEFGKKESDYFFKNFAKNAALIRKVPPVQEVFFALRNQNGALKGGIYGFYFYGSSLIDMLWVDEDLRHQGHGKKLMEQFEKYTKSLGATFSIVSTMDWWNVVPFYESLGYVVESVRGGYSNQSKQYTLRKIFNYLT